MYLWHTRVSGHVTRYYPLKMVKICPVGPFLPFIERLDLDQPGCPKLIRGLILLSTNGIRFKISKTLFKCQKLYNYQSLSWITILKYLVLNNLIQLSTITMAISSNFKSNFDTATTAKTNKSLIMTSMTLFLWSLKEYQNKLIRAKLRSAYLGTT